MDADFTVSGPSVAAVQPVLADLAPSFGHDASDVARYNNNFRNVVLSNNSAERLFIIYSKLGTTGIKKQIEKLQDEGKL